MKLIGRDCFIEGLSRVGTFHFVIAEMNFVVRTIMVFSISISNTQTQVWCIVQQKLSWERNTPTGDL